MCSLWQHPHHLHNSSAHDFSLIQTLDEVRGLRTTYSETLTTENKVKQEEDKGENLTGENQKATYNIYFKEAFA